MSVVNMDDYGKIRALSNGKVMSQRKMAKEVGKARQTVKKYKDGAVLPGQKQTRDRAPGVLTDADYEYFPRVDSDGACTDEHGTSLEFFAVVEDEERALAGYLTNESCPVQAHS